MRPAARRPLERKADPLHTRGLTEVDWKDYPYPPRRLRRLRRLPSPGTLLRTFISDRGKIRARHAIELARSPSTQHLRSGFTTQQQRYVAVAIRNAREMVLLPYSNAGRG